MLKFIGNFFVFIKYDFLRTETPFETFRLRGWNKMVVGRKNRILPTGQVTIRQSKVLKWKIDLTLTTYDSTPA